MACRYYNSSPGSNGFCSLKYEQLKKELRGPSISKNAGELTYTEKCRCKCNQEHYDTKCQYLNSSRHSNGCSFYKSAPSYHGYCSAKAACIRAEAGRGTSYESDGYLNYDEWKGYQCSNPSFSKNCPYRNGKVHTPKKHTQDKGVDRGSVNVGRGQKEPVDIIDFRAFYPLVILFIVIIFIQVLIITVGEGVGLIKPIAQFHIVNDEPLRQEDSIQAVRLRSDEKSREYKIGRKKGDVFEKEIRGGSYNVFLELEGEEIMIGQKDIHANFKGLSLLDLQEKNEYKINTSTVKKLSGYFEIIRIKNVDRFPVRENDISISGGNCLATTCIQYGDDGCFIVNIWGPESSKQELVLSINGYKNIPLSMDFSKKRVHEDDITLEKE